MAQFAIVIAIAMVVASMAGADVVGDSFSAGVVLGTVGLLLIANGIAWLWRHRRSRRTVVQDPG